jgi:oligosaccharide reducing-end xylanase
MTGTFETASLVGNTDISYKNTMKTIKITFVLMIAGLATILSACSPAEKISYEVAVWPGFKQAAVSYTFDDQCANQFTIAVPLFDEYGFKLTLYPVVDWGRWEEIKAAAANEHEVGSHTMTHPHLNTLSLEEQEEELGRSKQMFNDGLRIEGVDCNTVAYPYCDAGDLSVISRYYIAGRGCSQEIVPSTPADYYNISSIVCGNQGSVNTLADFQAKFTAAANVQGWCVLLLHGIDDDGGYSPLSSDVLRQSVEYLDKNRATFWVTTFRDAVLYAKERDAVSVVEKQRTASEIQLEITNNPDDTIYHYPLTIRCTLPSGWENVTVKQNNEILSSNIVVVNQGRSLVFDAVPDGGIVIITRIKD